MLAKKLNITNMDREHYSTVQYADLKFLCKISLKATVSRDFYPHFCSKHSIWVHFMNWNRLTQFRECFVFAKIFICKV